MQNNRNRKIILMIVLCIAVVGITVAYATMTTTLTIKGEAVMDTESWKIKLSNLVLDSAGAGSFTTEPEIVDEVFIENYVARLTKPGDQVIMKFNVDNAGSLDADLSSAVLGNLTCTSAATPAVENDANLVCGNLSYTLVYTDATTQEQTAVAYSAGAEVANGQKLLAGKSVNMTLKLEYTGNTLPSDNVNITIGDTTLVYNQAE